MDVMIDIETLANTSNSVITQIGAVVFDRKTGQVFEKFKVNVDGKSCQALGMEINVETVEWWMEQSDEARASVLMGPKIKIQEALEQLSNWFIESWKNHPEDGEPEARESQNYNPKFIKLWCHATFDEPNLENAYQKCDMETPWSFRSVRDLRTLLDLSEYKIDYEKGPIVAHDAMEDSIFQVGYTVECMNKLKG